MGEVRTPKFKPTQEQFQNSPVQVFETEMAQMGTTSRGLKLPSEGEQLTYEATYSINKDLRFKKEEGSTSFTCSFKYKKAKIIEKVTKVDGETYHINKTTIPVEPVYTGSPISDFKTKCEKDLSEGKFNRDVIYLIKEQFKVFKKFVRQNFVDKYNKCKARVRPVFLTCKDNGIDIEKHADDHVDFYKMIFVGSLKGNPLQLNISLNFEKIYFSNFGILEMDIIGISSSLSNITSIKTIDWKL